MRHHAPRFVFSRQVIAILLIATVIVSALAAPLGLRSASAQDDFSVQTRVMILHASPDLGKVEVFINNDEVLDEFEYGDLSDWIDIDPGSSRLTITYDRAGFNYAAFDAVYPVPAGNDYYVVITDAIVMTSVVDRSPVDGGSARVRVAQGAVDLPAIDVKVTPGDIELAADLTYPRSTDYESIPPGTYDIEVTLSDTGESVMTQSGVVLDGNTVYDLVIFGEPGDDDKPLEIRTLSDTTIEQADATPTS
jgi:Domain of unknown function (DUF4397)